MGSFARTGRVVGGLLLLQLAGLIVPFILLQPLTGSPQAYLAGAAGAAMQIKLAVLLLFLNGVLTVGLSIVMYGVERDRREPLSLALLAASVVMLLLQAVDNAHILTMLSLSEQVAGAAGPAAPYGALATMAATTRRWVHYTELLAIDGWILLLYVTLQRLGLVPRELTMLGVLTVLLHLVAIPLRRFAGASPITWMGVPMAFSHVLLGAWLVAKGFSLHHRPRGAIARDAEPRPA